MKRIVLIGLFLLSSISFANTPITLVVGFAPGGSADTSARIFAKGLSETLKTPVIVENKPGAGGVIAHKHVASSTPNGTVILFSSVGPLTVAHFNGVEPVATVVEFPHIFAVPTSLGVSSLKEFISLAKQKKLSYASTGVDSIPHAQGKVLSEKAGIDMLHVPYKGGSLAVIDVVAGRVDGFFAGLTVVEPHIKSGKLIPLAVSGIERSEFVPNIPTVSEQGIPGFDMPNAYILATPTNTPREVVSKLNTAVNQTLKTKEVATALQTYGFSPLISNEIATKRYVEKAIITYSPKNGGITLGSR